MVAVIFNNIFFQHRTLESKTINSAQRGVSLIEILITVLVVSVGLLGLATLQLKSLSLNDASNHRLLAINLAHDISDRIFVNGEAADEIIELNTSNKGYVIDLGIKEVRDPDSVANRDFNRWQLLAIAFNADFKVVMDKDPAVKDYDIVVCWPDKNVDITIKDADCNNQTGLSSFIMQTSRR